MATKITIYLEDGRELEAGTISWNFCPNGINLNTPKQGHFQSDYKYCGSGVLFDYFNVSHTDKISYIEVISDEENFILKDAMFQSLDQKFFIFNAMSLVPYVKPIKEEQEDRTGQIYNEYTGQWSWL